MRFKGVVLVGAVLAAQWGCDNDDSATRGTSTLVWEDRFDAGEANARNDDVASGVAACDGRVFVSGETSNESGDERALVVRAYESTTGELLWEDRVPTATQDPDLIACAHRRVFVAARRGPSVGVRAYRATNGAVLWDVTQEERASNGVGAMRVSEGLVVTSTTASFADQGRTVAIVRALNPVTGALVWEQRRDDMAPWHRASALSVSSSRACTVLSPADETEPRSLQCLDRIDGSLVWEAPLGAISPLVFDASAPSFSPDETIIAVYATGDPAGGALRAYEADSGRLVWERRSNRWVTLELLARDDAYLAAGVDFFLEDPEDFTSERSIFFVEALDVRTGRRLWRDEHVDEYVDGLTLTGDRLVVAGSEWQARIYDVLTGEVLREVSPQSEPPPRWLRGIASDVGMYFLAGALFASSSEPDDLDFAVRAYAYAEGTPSAGAHRD